MVKSDKELQIFTAAGQSYKSYFNSIKNCDVNCAKQAIQSFKDNLSQIAATSNTVNIKNYQDKFSENIFNSKAGSADGIRKLGCNLEKKLRGEDKLKLSKDIAPPILELVTLKLRMMNQILRDVPQDRKKDLINIYLDLPIFEAAQERIISFAINIVKDLRDLDFNDQEKKKINKSGKVEWAMKLELLDLLKIISLKKPEVLTVLGGDLVVRNLINDYDSFLSFVIEANKEIYNKIKDSKYDKMDDEEKEKFDKIKKSQYDQMNEKEKGEFERHMRKIFDNSLDITTIIKSFIKPPSPFIANAIIRDTNNYDKEKQLIPNS